MMAFLGVTGHYRQWIPECAEIAQPLHSMTHDHGLRPTDALLWTEDALKSFTRLKQALTTVPTLGLPDMTQPFTQTVCEKKGFMSSVLRLVAYLPSKLDGVSMPSSLLESGSSSCLSSVRVCMLLTLFPPFS